MPVVNAVENIEGYLLSRAGHVRRAPGYERRITCPFCGDSKGRCYVNTDPTAEIPGLFCCFVCNERGALPKLMRQFGDELPRTGDNTSDLFVRHAILEAATQFYQDQLCNPDSDAATRAALWLVHSRGIAPETISELRFGFAAYGLRKHLRSLGFSGPQIQLTGLVDSGGVEFFDGQITIPYLVSGSPVLIRGKTIGGKYLGPPGQQSRLFNSDVTFRNPESVVIVEGELDAVVLTQMGIPAVGVPGAGVWGDAWTNYFEEVKRLYICFDRDDAGEAGLAKLKTIFRNRARTVRMPLVEGDEKKNDPSEWIVNKGHTKEDFLALMARADDDHTPFRKASSVTPKKLEFFWNSRIPLGKVTVLAGIGGRGKGFITMALAAAVTAGVPLLDDGNQRLDGEVLMLSYEDDLEDTIVPRAQMLGVDLDRLHLLSPDVTLPNGRVRAFGPQDVKEAIETPLLENRNIKMVVIDPIGSFYADGTDSNAESAVRTALKGVVTAASKTGAAVIIVAHNKKGSSGNALHQIAGSQAVGAYARSVLTVGFWNGRPMIGHAKSNVAALAPTLGYSLDGGRFQWGHPVMGITADHLADPTAHQKGVQAANTGNYTLPSDVDGVVKLWNHYQEHHGVSFPETRQEMTIMADEFFVLHPEASWSTFVQIGEFLKTYRKPDGSRFRPRTFEGYLGHYDLFRGRRAS